jgi:hypothetical protein
MITLSAAACGPTPAEEVCGKVYDTCRHQLVLKGATMTKSECLAMIDGMEEQDHDVAAELATCVKALPCGGFAWLECFRRP